MTSFRHFLVTSDHPVVVRMRALFHAWRRGLALPAPRVLTVPYRVVYTTLRGAVFGFRRIFIAEPIFRSYCTSVGRGFRADIYVPWVQGGGRIIIGDDVSWGGKANLSFARRFTPHPTLRIGHRTSIGHDCVFVIAREVSLGEDCRIAERVTFREAMGHPLEPEARRRGEAPAPETVLPIVIEDNVWIGSGAIIQTGVTIGAGSVVAAGAIVTSSMAPNSLIAGNPARRIGVTTAAPSPSPQPGTPS